MNVYDIMHGALLRRSMGKGDLSATLYPLTRLQQQYLECVVVLAPYRMVLFNKFSRTSTLLGEWSDSTLLVILKGKGDSTISSWEEEE